MIEMTLAEVAAAVGGTLVHADPAARVTGAVEFDSRRIGPGDLFAAFVGTSVDGHDFAPTAASAGAVVVLGTRDVAPVPAILVPDTRTALAALARAVVDRLTAAGTLTVIGLTGSSGKTTTKDLIAQLVSPLGPTVAPAGSLNNELGHPYTVLRAEPHTRFLVLEMGARAIGDIAYLCRVAPPRVGVVLNVGVSHLGEFGSVAAIAQAKGELVEALPPDGVAVLNADDPAVSAMSARTAAAAVHFGESTNPEADVRATGVTLDERGRPEYTLHYDGASAAVRLGLTGAHQVSNSLAAAAVALSLGVPVPAVAAALAEVRVVSPRRMDVYDRPDGITVVDDSYNANPASTAAALRALAALGHQRRRIAVLGYMAELGEHERAGHERVGRLAAELGVDRLVVVGEPAAAIHEGATASPRWGGESILVGDQEAAVAVLRDELRPGDVVLVKGSRYRTWEVADWLREPADAGVVTRCGQ